MNMVNIEKLIDHQKLVCRRLLVSALICKELKDTTSNPTTRKKLEKMKFNNLPWTIRELSSQGKPSLQNLETRPIFPYLEKKLMKI